MTERSEARRLWRAFRAAPLRAEPLEELAGLLAAEREAARDDDWRGLVTLLATTAALDHVASVQSRRVEPGLVGLLVARGRVAPEEALARVDLGCREGAELLGQVWRGLSAEALRSALARLWWGSYLACDEGEAIAMLRRVAEGGWPEEVVGRAMHLAEPQRTRVLAGLRPALAGAPAAEVDAALALRLGERGDPFARAAEVAAVKDAVGAELWAALRGAADGWEEALGEEVRAAEWRRLAAIAEPGARLDAWERRMAELGSRATEQEARRWLAELRAAIAARPDEVYRVQTGVPAALHAEALAGLSPALACEAQVWLTRGEEAYDARAALAAVLAAELPDGDRSRLLALLLERLDAEAAAEAARRLLATPGRSFAEAVAAARRLTGAEQAAAVDELCREPFVVGRAAQALWPVLAALARLAEGSGPEGQAEIVGLARAAVAGWTEAEQVAALVGFTPAMTAEGRAELAARGLAEGVELAPQVEGVLIGLLPAAEVAGALAGRIARAREVADAHERWSALSELVAGLPDEQGAEILRGVWRAGVPAAEVHAFPRWAMDDELHRARAAYELAHPYRPYTAWLLGMDARHLPADERGPVLERAIDEFAAIAMAPTSPGNDAGPFVDMADLLDERQVRRALGVVARMAAAPWGSDLECARQHLALRLAALGRAAEAEARIRASPAYDRPWALGALAGVLLSQGTGWATAARLVEGDDAEAVFTALQGLTWATSAAARAGWSEVAPEFLAWVPRLADADARAEALAGLVAGFGPALAAETWVAAIRAHAQGVRRCVLLLTAAALAGESAAGLIEEALAEPVDDPEDVLQEYCAVAGALAWERRGQALARWVRAYPQMRSTFLTALQEGPLGGEAAAVLRGLGGDEAVVAAARALLAVAALLD